MAKHKLYENIVIGNFLYGLGFAVRAKRGSGITATVVNLLQQTPADKLLGDLLLESSGVVRLIEFKAAANRSKKEEDRHGQLSEGLAGDAVMQAISRSIHWYVETEPTDSGIDVRVVPYLDAFPKATKQDRLETFIDQTASEITAGTSNVTKEAAATYLRWVRLTLGEGGEVGSGGLLLIADADGTLHYAPLFDLLELRLKHRLWIDLQEKRFERELSQQRELNKDVKERRGPSHEPGVGGR